MARPLPELASRWLLFALRSVLRLRVRRGHGELTEVVALMEHFRPSQKDFVIPGRGRSQASNGGTSFCGSDQEKIAWHGCFDQ